MRIQKGLEMSSATSSSVRSPPPKSNSSGTASAVEDKGAYEGDSCGSSIGSLEEEWDLGSNENKPTRMSFTEHASNRDGELILSGDEDSSCGEKGRNGVALEQMFLTAADLSLPGTDSLPTDLDSLDIVSYIPSSAAGTSLRSRPLSTGTLEDDDLELPRLNRQHGRVARSNLLVQLLLTTTMVSTVLSAYLAWDRSAWRAAALRLEDELQSLRSDLSINSSKCSRSNKERSGCSSTLGNSSDFDWDGECHPHEKKIVIADNCWLHAEAALSFGDCAENIRSAIKNFFDHVGSEMANAMSIEPVEEPPRMEAEDYFGFSSGRPQTAGFTLQNLVEATSSIATATSTASDAVVAAISDASGFLDEYVSKVVSATRDAIEDSSFQSHIDNSYEEK